MVKINNLMGLFKSNIVYSFKKEIKDVKGKQVLSSGNVDAYFKQLSKLEKLFCAYLDDLTVQILYEGYLVNNLIRRDYSKDLYSKISDYLRLDTESISSEILNYIANEYIKTFDKLTVAFYNDSKKTRYIISCSKGDTTFINKKHMSEFINYSSVLFSKKKILTFSRYADLIKVQFIKLKSSNLYRTRFDYNLFSLDLNEIISNTDRTTYFETLDALKMKVLNYTFDIGLISNSVFSFLLAGFIYSLKSSAILLDQSLYNIFDIVQLRQDIPSNSKDYISLQDYNSATQEEDFTATSYLAKSSLIEQQKKDNK